MPQDLPAQPAAPGDDNTAPPPEALTINQVVAYNLMRARRIKGWTQREAAQRLQSISGKHWTSATLSASESSWRTGRSREFDANELLCFSLTFDQPIPYFFLPLSQKTNHAPSYALSKPGTSPPETVDADKLLKAAVPLRYPATLIDEVNSLLRPDGLCWTPSADVDWYRPEEQESLPAPEDESRNQDETEWQLNNVLAMLTRTLAEPNAKAVLRVLSEALKHLEQVPAPPSPSSWGEQGGEPPF